MRYNTYHDTDFSDCCKMGHAGSAISPIMIQVLVTVVKVGHAVLCPIVTQVLATVVNFKKGMQRYITYHDTGFSDCCKSGARSAMSYRDTSFSDWFFFLMGHVAPHHLS